MVSRKHDERPSKSIGYLFSILVRCPEVGTVKYDPRVQTVRYSLLLTGTLTEQEFTAMRTVLTDTLEVYNLLEHRQPTILQIRREEFGELTAIFVTRDTATVSPPEVWTVLEFLRDRFPDRLVSESVDYGGEDELQAQDEMIEEILTHMEGGRAARDLIAIREEGRVMVFQK